MNRTNNSKSLMLSLLSNAVFEDCGYYLVERLHKKLGVWGRHKGVQETNMPS